MFEDKKWRMLGQTSDENPLKGRVSKEKRRVPGQPEDYGEREDRLGHRVLMLLQEWL